MPKELTKQEREPTPDQIAELHEELCDSKLEPPWQPAEFKQWLKQQAEANLFFFCKWIMGHKDGRNTWGKMHPEVCEWMTNGERHKLCMLPVGHRKTTLFSHGLPAWAIIQPLFKDALFPSNYTGGRGVNIRIALAAENHNKAVENLTVIKETFETNPWIVWLWPDTVWDNFNNATRWSVDLLQFPRTRIWREPTVTPFGVEEPITGGHYDIIIADDLVTIKAGASPVVMDKGRLWLKRSFTRLHDSSASLHIGIGTHQSNDDIYLDWQKRSTVDVMVRAIEEEKNGVMGAIWPEYYTPERLKQERDNTDAITWSLWYMNRPVSSGFSAMDWSDLREFRWIGKTDGLYEMPWGLEFAEDERDGEFTKQKEWAATPLSRLAHGMPLSPVKGDRQAFIRRYFADTVGPELREHMKEKYPDGSPAQTREKELIESVLGEKR